MREQHRLLKGGMESTNRIVTCNDLLSIRGVTFPALERGVIVILVFFALLDDGKLRDLSGWLVVSLTTVSWSCASLEERHALEQ